MYKLKNNILIFVISTVAIFISIIFINVVEVEYNNWANTFLSTSISDIEIMTTNYYENRKLMPRKYYLYNYEDYLKTIKGLVDENNITYSLVYSASILSPKYEYPVVANGIDSEKYRLLFSAITNIAEGNYLDKAFRNSCIIGIDAAKKLKLKVGDRFILRLLDVNNLYKAEEIIVSGIFESGNEEIDKKNIFINISLLNELIADRYAISSIHVKLDSNNKNIYPSLKKIFTDDIGIYTKYDMYNMIAINENKMLSIKRYIYLFFSIVVFALYFYINAKAYNSCRVPYFNSTLLFNLLFSLLGFLVAIVLSTLFLKTHYNTNFTLLFILNVTLLVISSILPYIATKKRIKTT